MAIFRYEPYALQQQINQLFDELLGNEPFGRSEELGGGMFSPPLDVRENNDAYIVQLDLPGVAQDNLNVTLQEGVLLVRGEKPARSGDGGSARKYRRVERPYGTFARSLRLPRNVDGSAVQANLRDGVLTVTLPKSPEARPRQIAIHTTHEEA